MDWYPLRLSTPTRHHVFGGTALTDQLGRRGLPPGRVAETWEVSDVDGDVAVVLEGPLQGRSLRELTVEYPDELVGPGWRGPHFPILTKFIDGTGMLPVHLHADDAGAQRRENQPDGKTEAWHILAAAPGATALVGLQPGVDPATLRKALLRQDYDAVMRRLPVRAGETIYLPGGTLHSFGPDTLVYEIEQTSDVQQHAMPTRMEDGSKLGTKEWHANLDRLLEELKPESRPDFQPGLPFPGQAEVEHLVLCAGPYFALERWRTGSGVALQHAVDRALIVSNVGAPFTLAAAGWSGELGPAESILLPAALGHVEITGPANLLLGYLPDLERDVRAPLAAAGHDPALIARLGEGLDHIG